MTMNDYDAVMGRLGAVKPVDQRDPFLGEGQHELIVHSVAEYNDQKWGKSFRWLFLVQNSTKHPPGSLVARTYNINKPSMFPTQSNDADQLVDLICVLQGIKLGEHQASTKALLVSRTAGGNMEAQPARGCRIDATGMPPGAGMTAAGKPKTYTRITWRTVPNDAGAMAQARAMLDAKFPVGAPQAPVQQYQQAPQQFAQPQYQQAPVQQYAPVQQPQYQQAPPQQFAAPYAPQAPVQQQFVQQPSQPPQQPVQGAPQGGFLAMLPPKQG